MKICWKMWSFPETEKEMGQMAVDREQFKQLLKDNGLKITNQRLLVLEALASCPDKHLTAEEIYDRTCYCL